MTNLDYNLDGNQEEPVCDTCEFWKPGPEEDSMGQYWSHLMSCWNGSYRPSWWTGLRVTHPNSENYKAPGWCPRRLWNSQCTCGECPQCITLRRERNQ